MILDKSLFLLLDAHGIGMRSLDGLMLNKA